MYQLKKNKKLVVLHAFDQYLNTTENWIYRIISNFSDIQVVITSNFLLENKFHSDRFEYIEFPLEKIQGYSENPFDTIKKSFPES